MDKDPVSKISNIGLTVISISVKLNTGTATSISIIDQISFHAEPGEFVCIVGPSGCGKTTLLNVCAGFTKSSSGMVLVNKRTVCCPHPSRAMVFQQDSLFPWLTVEQNIMFGPKCQDNREADSDTYIDLVGLKGFEKYYPHQLSGGMKQRAALARVLINKPDILFLDEPFGALDAQSREEMQDVLLEVCYRTHTMALLVTHDVEEAVFLGDRVLVMSSRPTRILADIVVPLDRPRAWDVREDPIMSKLKTKIRALIAHPDYVKNSQTEENSILV